MNMLRWFRRNRDELDCHQVAEQLQQYLDAEIDDAQAAKIAEHLDACKACGLEAQTYRELKDALARRRPDVDNAAVERLRDFGRSLAGD